MKFSKYKPNKEENEYSWNSVTEIPFFYQYRNVFFGVFVLCSLLLLHINYKSDSYFDYLFYETCESIHCSFIYSIIESITWVYILFMIYWMIFNSFWRFRYKYKNAWDTFDNFDSIILSFPWLISPILAFHSLTSCIIDISLLFSLYDSQSTDNDENYIFNEYQQQKCNLCRTMISFIIWIILDTVLWKESQLIYLFEYQPNRAIKCIFGSNYTESINNILLKHVGFVDDLSTLILSYLDLDINWRLMEIKESIYNNLNKSNLNEPFLYLAVINAVVSGYRLFMTPSAVIMLFPVMVFIGAVAIILLIFLLIFALLLLISGGSNSSSSTIDCGKGNNNCPECKECFCGCPKFYACLGMILSGILWTAFVWFIMKLKLDKLNKIQQDCNDKHQYKRVSFYDDDIVLDLSSTYYNY